MSIGRGYSRRLTFEASPGLLNDNENYFWTDSMPSGYAFQVHVVSVGDNFTVFDANNVAVATIEVTKIPVILNMLCSKFKYIILRFYKNIYLFIVKLAFII